MQLSDLDRTWTRQSRWFGIAAPARWLTAHVWTDCSDEVLLAELAVIVNAGWALPQRPNRWSAVRHLSLLVAPADSLRPPQAAERLLLLIDRTLREADDEDLSEDDATGCRILLGTHPTYRSVTSPTERRAAAGDMLITGWRDKPPGDPAGAFLRRHQVGVLTLVLGALRLRFADETDTGTHDVARVERWYEVNAQRQIVAYGETSYYRVLREGLTSIEIIETEPEPEGLIGSVFSVEPVDGHLRTASITRDPTLPGFRRIDIELQQRYDAGDIVRLGWREVCEYASNAPDWGRLWVTVNTLNDHCEVDLTVRFRGDEDLPDLCWWFSAEPITDLGEIGPDSLDHLIELTTSADAATHAWSGTQTERRRLYGLLWCWLDEESGPRWDEARARLEGEQ